MYGQKNTTSGTGGEDNELHTKIEKYGFGPNAVYVREHKTEIITPAGNVVEKIIALYDTDGNELVSSLSFAEVEQYYYSHNLVEQTVH